LHYFSVVIDIDYVYIIETYLNQLKPIDSKFCS